jgi:hypothetical protein
VQLKTWTDRTLDVAPRKLMTSPFTENSIPFIDITPGLSKRKTAIMYSLTTLYI